jgi:hypothetical protein
MILMNFKAIVITALSFACIALPSSARADECQDHFQTSRRYGTWHQGPSLAFTGKIKIQQTYDCPQGTCFTAQMTFDNYNSNRDVATGFWSGSSFELKRFVQANNSTQVWSGQCMPNSVRGTWYIENEASNNGPFSITY